MISASSVLMAVTGRSALVTVVLATYAVIAESSSTASSTATT